MNYLTESLLCDNKLNCSKLKKPFIYSVVFKSASCSIVTAIAEHLGIRLIPNRYPSRSQLWSHYHCSNLRPFLDGTRFHFSFVRNPYDRIVSAWMMFQVRRAKPFKTFVKENLVPSNKDPHIVSQLRTLYPLPNFLGRFENINSDWKIVQQHTDLGELPKLNKTNHKPYQEYYDEEIKDLVSEYYKKDLEIFGYKFE